MRPATVALLLPAMLLGSPAAGLAQGGPSASPGTAPAAAATAAATAADGIAVPFGDRPGDPARGRAIVVDRQAGLCLLCHSGPFPEERFQGTLATDLAGAGARWSVAQLRLRIADSRRLNPDSLMPPHSSPVATGARARNRTAAAARNLCRASIARPGVGAVCRSAARRLARPRRSAVPPADRAAQPVLQPMPRSARRQTLGGAPIPQAHPTGYPLYRLEWQAVGSLQRRLRNCSSGVRAEPFGYGSEAAVQLELYLAERARGMPLETPAIRP